MKYLTKDQNWMDGSTTYWFDFDGDTVGVVESGNEDPQVVDVFNFPVNLDDSKNAHLLAVFDLVSDVIRMA